MFGGNLRHAIPTEMSLINFRKRLYAKNRQLIVGRAAIGPLIGRHFLVWKEWEIM